MHIVLSSSFNPGDMDPGVTYPHFKIVNVSINTSYSGSADWLSSMYNPTSISCQYGEVEEVSGSWVAGVKTVNYNITGSSLEAIFNATASLSESVYNAFVRNTYDWLLDGRISGTLTGTL